MKTKKECYIHKDKIHMQKYIASLLDKGDCTHYIGSNKTVGKDNITYHMTEDDYILRVRGLSFHTIATGDGVDPDLSKNIIHTLVRYKYED